MRRALLLGALLCGTGYPAAQPSTVGDVVRAVDRAVEGGWKDGQLAKALRKLHLAEALDQHALEELESRFDGPKSAEELQRLHDESEGFQAPAIPPRFDAPAAPDASEQKRILQQAAENALSYAASMPDFICTQTVRRYELWGGRESWDLKDTLVIKLSYFDHVEDYKLATVNGHATKLTYENLRGAITEGEFASMLVNVFEPDAHVEFWWDHWTNLRRRAALVFRFRIKKENSHYRMDYGSDGRRDQVAIAGQHGFVYVDRQTHRIVRILAEADSLPPDFPVQGSSTVLDYGFVDIGGRDYLLPLHADARMATYQVKTRNVMAFTGYRKFAGESTITFQVPEDSNPEKDKPPPGKK